MIAEKIAEALDVIANTPLASGEDNADQIAHADAVAAIAAQMLAIAELEDTSNPDLAALTRVLSARAQAFDKLAAMYARVGLNLTPENATKFGASVVGIHAAAADCAAKFKVS